MALQDRLNAYLEYRQLSPKDFERICGLGNGTASSLTENVRSTTLHRISRGCPDLNIEWLCSGEGTMLKENINITNSLNGENSTSSNNSNVSTNSNNPTNSHNTSACESC